MHDSNFSALSGHSNRITVLKRARPKAVRATNRSKIGDTDPERSLFPDTYKMLPLRTGPPETCKCGYTVNCSYCATATM